VLFAKVASRADMGVSIADLTDQLRDEYGAQISYQLRKSLVHEAVRHPKEPPEIAKLKHGADVQVRVIAVPDDWVPPKPGTFVTEVMNNLADLGEKMGADPASWRAEPP
jgi:hypothetical protein